MGCRLGCDAFVVNRFSPTDVFLARFDYPDTAGHSMLCKFWIWPARTRSTTALKSRNTKRQDGGLC